MLSAALLLPLLGVAAADGAADSSPLPGTAEDAVAETVLDCPRPSVNVSGLEARIGVGDTCPLWTASEPAERDAMQGHAVAVDPTGERVYMTGLEYDPVNTAGSTPAAVTAAYDAESGQSIWAVRHPERYTSRHVAVGLGGTSVVTAGVDGNGALLTVARDASDGDVLWSAHEGVGRIHAVAVSPDGRTLYVGGREEGSERVSAYDIASGQTLWSIGSLVAPVGCPSPTTSTVTGLAVDPEGRRLYLTGRSFPPGGGIGQLPEYPEARVGLYVCPDGPEQPARAHQVVALDTQDGSIAWASAWKPLRKRHHQADLGVAADGSGVYVVSSTILLGSIHACSWGEGSLGTDSRNHATIRAFDADTGDGRWTRHYSRGWHDDPALGGLDVSPDGQRVYMVVGSRRLQQGCPVASSVLTHNPLWRGEVDTIAYETSSGDEVWRRHYNLWDHQNEHAVPVSIAVSSRDGVYVLATQSLVRTPWDNPTTVQGTEARRNLAVLAYEGSSGDSVWNGVFPAGGGEEETPDAVAEAIPSPFATGHTGGWTGHTGGLVTAPDGGTAFVVGSLQRSRQGLDRRAVVLAYAANLGGAR